MRDYMRGKITASQYFDRVMKRVKRERRRRRRATK